MGCAKCYWTGLVPQYSPQPVLVACPDCYPFLNRRVMVSVLQWPIEPPCDEPLSLPVGDSGVQKPVDEV